MMKTQYINTEISFINYLSNIINDLLITKNKNNKYYMKVIESSPNIITLSINIRNSKKVEIRLYAFKLELSKLRITIFPIESSNIIETIKQSSVVKFNILTYEGKKLFINLFTELIKYINLKVNFKDKEYNTKIADRNRNALSLIKDIENKFMLKK